MLSALSGVSLNIKRLLKIWLTENLNPCNDKINKSLHHQRKFFFSVDLYSSTKKNLNVQRFAWYAFLHYVFIFFYFFVCWSHFSCEFSNLCSSVIPKKKPHTHSHKQLALNMMFYRWFQWYITVRYSKCCPAKNRFNADHTDPWFEFRLSNVSVLFHTAYSR